MDDLLGAPRHKPDHAALGGFRSVRALGVGDRSRVVLGVADDGERVAVKHYRRAITDAAVIREAAVLDLVADLHAVRLIDVSGDDAGRPMLVLEALRGGSLGELLTLRTALSPGECVTVLAPIADLIGRLHDRGIAHGAVAARHIVFTADGVPVLVGWGSAVTRGSVAFERARDDDRTALLALADGLLPGLRSARASRMPQPDDLVDLLHSIAAAAPVDFRPTPPGPVESARWHGSESDTVGQTTRVTDSTPFEPQITAPGPSHVVDPLPEGGDAVTDSATVLTQGPVPGLLFALAEWPDRVLHLLQRGDEHRGGFISATVRRLGQRARAQIAALSRRQRILGAAGLIALIVSAVMLLQPLQGADAGAAVGGQPTDAREAVHGVESVGGGQTSTGGGDPALTLDLRATIEGADPEAALRALLRIREQCLLEISVSCLAAVVQTGSSAERDAIATLVGDSGEAVPLAPLPDEFRVIAVDRLGDSILFRVEAAETTPASVLVIRTEAGWRIRMLAAA